MLFFNPEHYKKAIEANFQRQTGIRLDLGELIHYDWMPLDISLADVQLAKPATGAWGQWEHATVTLNPLALITHKIQAVHQLQAWNGQIHFQGKQIAIPYLKVVHGAKGYQATLRLRLNHQSIEFSGNIHVGKHKTFTIDQVKIEDQLLVTQDQTMKMIIKAPSVNYIATQGGFLEIPTMQVNINQQHLTGQVAMGSLKPLAGYVKLHTPTLSIQNLLNNPHLTAQANNWQMQLQIDQHSDQEAINMRLKADESKLSGGDLNHSAEQIKQLVNQVKHVDHFQQIIDTAEQLAAQWINDQGALKIDHDQTTHVNQWQIQSHLTQSEWDIDQINAQADEFTLTGKGRCILATAHCIAPLKWHIDSTPSITIPSQLIWDQDTGVSIHLDQSSLEKLLRNTIKQQLQQFWLQ